MFQIIVCANVHVLVATTSKVLPTIGDLSTREGYEVPIQGLVRKMAVGLGLNDGQSKLSKGIYRFRKNFLSTFMRKRVK